MFSEKKKEAFLTHLANKYPLHYDVIQGRVMSCCSDDVQFCVSQTPVASNGFHNNDCRITSNCSNISDQLSNGFSSLEKVHRCNSNISNCSKEIGIFNVRDAIASRIENPLDMSIPELPSLGFNRSKDVYSNLRVVRSPNKSADASKGLYTGVFSQNFYYRSKLSFFISDDYCGTLRSELHDFNFSTLILIKCTQ